MMFEDILNKIASSEINILPDIDISFMDDILDIFKSDNDIKTIVQEEYGMLDNSILDMLGTLDLFDVETPEQLETKILSTPDLKDKYDIETIIKYIKDDPKLIESVITKIKTIKETKNLETLVDSSSKIIDNIIQSLPTQVITKIQSEDPEYVKMFETTIYEKVVNEIGITSPDIKQQILTKIQSETKNVFENFDVTNYTEFIDKSISNRLTNIESTLQTNLKSQDISNNVENINNNISNNIEMLNSGVVNNILNSNIIENKVNQINQITSETNNISTTKEISGDTIFNKEIFEGSTTENYLQKVTKFIDNVTNTFNDFIELGSDKINSTEIVEVSSEPVFSQETIELLTTKIIEQENPQITNITNEMINIYNQIEETKSEIVKMKDSGSKKTMLKADTVDSMVQDTKSSSNQETKKTSYSGNPENLVNVYPDLRIPDPLPVFKRIGSI